ncbi:hypothetical protein PTTG_26554 [Puccinia triticina 1-1 BBBD Race 1]|uniref:DUF6589 domain-containing protein n=1 Tax=Puccinia triticina (isolate 1-1 / race 1 (BBBD)) TaxID=630390 RepID=A0A180GS64_PUCT1|nr:hypothetical protein PTTG_26554 [Puccinia triticina 1-1 BBBD Race 1]
MTEEHMPFLHGLIFGMLQQRGIANDTSMANKDAREAANLANETSKDAAECEDFGEVAYIQELTGQDRVNARFARIATTICSIVAFAHNRRHNALQLRNSVRFLACGVSERIHKYLNYLGLASSRRTALSALKTLSKEGEANIRKVMAVKQNIPLAPSICIDNIDMVQRVHDLSVGNRSNTFCGTWGYIHVPNNSLLCTLNLEELTLNAFRESLRNVPDFTIEPAHFMPAADAQASEVAIWKSQIARVLQEHLAIPSKSASATPINPPVIDQISHKKPTIHMLKLMDASDNSAEGIGQVFTTILHQSGLLGDEFYGRLQPMDGDLGTIQNFNSLRSQRTPSPHGKDNLKNVLFQLGASHTLWNIVSTTFTHHFGDPSDDSNCGAWQFLEALGFPSEKAIQKKEFTLMINQMERVMEATLYYCLRVVMKTQFKNLSEERQTIPTACWNAIIDECYDQFCSPKARRAAAKGNCPKLNNTLILLHDFSSVVEAMRSMSLEILED